MSKHEIVRELRYEIKKINREIDLRIIRGIPYADKSRRHKFLVSQLRRLQPTRSSIFSPLKFASMFLF